MGRNDKKRDPNLDLLRVAAIALVTFFHVWRFIGQPSKSVGPFNLAAPLEKGVMGVTIFVFLSGFLCQSSTGGKKPLEFLLHKILRLAPPYYVALIVWNVLLFLGVTMKTHSPWDNISHVLFIQNLSESTFYSISGVFWYVALQLQLYIMYIFFRHLILSYPLKSILCSLVVTVLSNSVLAVSFPVLDRSVLSYALPFVLGIVVASCAFNLSVFRKWSVAGMVLILTIVFSLLPPFLPGRLDYIVNGLLICIFVAVLPTCKAVSLFGAISLPLATASYSIYLYNYIIYCFRPAIHGIGGLLAYTAIVFVFGSGAFLLVERPLNNFIRKTHRVDKRQYLS